MNRLDYAKDYQGRGYTPLPLPLKAKNPGFHDWQKYQPVNGRLERDFSNEGNIGLLLGKPSGWLIDVDLDWPESQRLASAFLPETTAKSGRESAPLSHYWYHCETGTKKFSDPTKPGGDDQRAMIVELRSTGLQTVVEPSIHPSGERYVWQGELMPAQIDAATLQRAVARLAACALVARHWPQGRRHDAALALAGALFRNAWARADVERFILSAAGVAGDEEIEDRKRAIADTEEKLRRGEHVTGLPTLSEFIGEKTVGALVKWLGLTAQPEKPAEAISNQSREPVACPYKANGIGLVWLKPVATRDGAAEPLAVQLTNFIAEITGEVCRDDGAEQTRVYEITAQLAGETASHKGAVVAEEFGLLKWPATILGARAVIYPSKKEHTGVAIQLLSRKIESRRVVAHTGWRNDGNGWRYYHAAGAIGAEGLIDAEVELPTALAAYSLPAPPVGETLKDTVSAVIGLAGVGPDDVTLPTLGAVWASVLTGADFSIYLAGRTGSGKSILTALFLSLFGSGFDFNALPASWSSTGNSLESLAHAAKDCVLAVDDFCPQGSAADQARLQAAADRIFRAQGNHSGRLRCRTDGTVRAVKPPRGLILSTGEDIPHGQSLRARTLIREVVRESLDWPAITEAQAIARQGVYAQAMAAFLQWLATGDRIEKLRASAPDDVSRWREEWTTRGLNGHKRNASTLAQLARAWHCWLGFACEAGAITPEESKKLWRRVWAALDAAGKGQEQYQASENPASRFIELIQAALASGKAHLAATDGGKPDSADAQAFGWRDGEPQGERIGWLDGDDLYLQPDAAYLLARRMATDGEGLTVSSQTLWKRLNEAGLLASTDTARKTNKVRKTIAGKSNPVIHLRSEIFAG
ncbi:MAG TPA: bifunctional DNA primase/polymerase [Blastocatellia bacterium]|nr:bifunctional DNA primase/polymerase [Blastocatellia bacterium]HMV83698.1 bifunctional DNA primase/polymerase [Blastocatellia bacterium]HMX24853.1 bifunctional DNA primase/polymerase [Blastocatellia bacterium]HMY70886.1 bifunctional DNA primase/polymerase [Blastocatellia bacterium]HMZ19031.1 bifunctional DNA primase/polymerase [Blastocatellia bacterium]